MYDKKLIEKRFAEAGLTVKFGNIIRVWNKEIFGVMVDRKVGGNIRDEWFTMQPGNDDNDVTVIDIDKKLHQILLMVKEPKREFIYDNWGQKHKGSTSALIRKFLMGLDERQLFMCQVNRSAKTVKDAHKLLKSPEVHTAEGKLGRATRQGEWFFLPTTEQEVNMIEESIKRHMIFVEHKKRIAVDRGREPGKPHTADEIVIVPSKKLEHGFGVKPFDVYVRGKVRHADHETVSFPTWRRVMRNAEDRSALVGTWID